MRKRLLLLLVMWPLLAQADSKYGLSYEIFILLALWGLLVLGVIPLAIAQVVGRVLRWLLGRRFNLWVLSVAALAGCWLGTYRPLDFNRPEPELMAKNTVVVVAGPNAPHLPPSVQYLAAFAAGAVILTALVTAAIAFWERRNQYPEQEE